VCRVRPLCSSTIRQKPVHAEELARDNCRTASNDEQSAPKPSKMLPLGRVIVLLVRVARAQTLKSGLMGASADPVRTTREAFSTTGQPYLLNRLSFDVLLIGESWSATFNMRFKQSSRMAPAP
jgi:hypothetical protein